MKGDSSVCSGSKSTEWKGYGGRKSESKERSLGRCLFYSNVQSIYATLLEGTYNCIHANTILDIPLPDRGVKATAHSGSLILSSKLRI